MIPKPSMLAAMTVAPLRGFLVANFDTRHLYVKHNGARRVLQFEVLVNVALVYVD